jgi:hypothetical protein
VRLGCGDGGYRAAYDGALAKRSVLKLEDGDERAVRGVLVGDLRA